MNDFDDLDDILGPLRSAATPAELAGESSIVDAMARNHRTTKGSSTMFSSRRARVAAFVAAGVIGFGGVAAAGPGGPLSLTGSDDTTTTSEATTTTVEEVVEEIEVEETTTTTEVQPEEDLTITRSAVEEIVDEQEVVEEDEEVVDEPARDDPNTYFREDLYCLDGNHGKTVSAAARGDDEYLDQFPEGFEAYTQSQVAQSSCGKDYEGVIVEDDDSIDDLDDKQDVEEKELDDDRDDEKKQPAKAEKPKKSGPPEHAGSRGNGKKGRG